MIGTGRFGIGVKDTAQTARAGNSQFAVQASGKTALGFICSLSGRELSLRTIQEVRRKENLLRRRETIPVGTRLQVFLQVFSDLLAMKAAVLDKDLVGT